MTGAVSAAGGLRTCFVIPTYDEAANIKPLLQRLAHLHPSREAAFLIVDDGSPDGTANLVRECSAKDSRIHLLEGERRGLGDAYLRGITHAIDVLGAEAVVQMDADFSHDPAAAGRLLAHIAADADVAVGSRYVAGGSFDPRWGLGRRLLSRWGNRFARWVAGLGGVRDCTSGFKAIKTTALRAAGIHGIRARGYVFQVVLLHRLQQAGARIVEDAIHFRERDQGRTKLAAKDAWEFFLQVLWLRLANYRNVWKFGLSGLLAATVNLGAFQLLLDLGMNKYLASPIAVELSIIVNFLINSHWTFGDRRLAGPRRVQGLRFNFIALLTLALNFAIFVTLSLLFPSAPPLLLQACAIAPVAGVNYLVHFHWTFREVGERP